MFLCDCLSCIGLLRDLKLSVVLNKINNLAQVMGINNLKYFTLGKGLCVKSCDILKFGFWYVYTIYIYIIFVV